jgi:hypothetical protein
LRSSIPTAHIDSHVSNPVIRALLTPYAVEMPRRDILQVLLLSRWQHHAPVVSGSGGNSTAQPRRREVRHLRVHTHTHTHTTSTQAFGDSSIQVVVAVVGTQLSPSRSTYNFVPNWFRRQRRSILGISRAFFLFQVPKQPTQTKRRHLCLYRHLPSRAPYACRRIHLGIPDVFLASDDAETSRL